MTCWKKNLGISLLEQFLAIGLVLIILLLGLERYNTYQRDVEVREIRNDLDRIFFAMGKYFHLIGCKTDGYFPANHNNGNQLPDNPLTPDISKTLKLTDLALGRPPITDKYSTQIIQFGTRKHDHKPLYQFIISAKPNQKISRQKVDFIARKTGAEVTADHKLQWHALPSQPLSKANATLILSHRLYQLRHDLRVHKPKQGHSFCAQ